MSQTTYRSLSFHGIPQEADFPLIRLGANLGFTDVTVQLEGKNSEHLPKLADEGRSNGFFKLLKELGLTLSVWTHEISEIGDVVGELEPENTALWESVRNRYTRYMTELLPEVDFWVLTVVETRINLTDRRMLARLVETINRTCREHGRRLVLRTFVHDPEELDEVRAVVETIEDDVLILSKYVPQDWHLRAGPEPLIGHCGKNVQWVELDICGEYFRNTHLANCMGAHLQKHFRIWEKAGISGISVRVDRRARPGAWWEPMVRNHSIWGTPQEFNLFALTHLADGGTLKEAWTKFSAHFTGRTDVDLRPALEHTGTVVEEALCVENEPFGGRTDVIAEWTMNGKHAKTGDTQAVAYSDEADSTYRTPFHEKRSAFRWQNGLGEDYHRLRKGDPEAIISKARAAQAARTLAIVSLVELKKIEEQLAPTLAQYLRFLLQENLWHLEVMTHAALAWMKAYAQLYDQPGYTDPPEATAEIEEHLQALESLKERQSEMAEVHIRNHPLTLRRGEYLHLNRTITQFREFWKMPEPDLQSSPAGS